MEKVQALIDALPETVTAENRAEVEAQLTAIDDAKLPLTEEERDALDFGKYNAAIAAINAMDDMAGAEVPKTLLEIQYITAIGNGEGNWLNGSPWEANSEDNRMTKASSDVWEITYENIDKFDNYMVKFVCNGEWSILSWGSDGTLDSTTAVCNGENIIFAVVQNNSTVKLVLDLSGFDSETMQGAKYYIYVNGVQINGKSATVGYTITFAPNGGTLPEGTSTTATTDADGKLATLPTPTKSGCYAFVGWYSGETKWSTDSVATENITLTAKWSDGSNVTSEEELRACVEAGISNIKLGGDITLNSTLTISGKSLTLDLNGHKLSSSATITVSVGAYEGWTFVPGTLTVTDTGSGGTIENTNTDGY